jgi:hypothetical protein
MKNCGYDSAAMYDADSNASTTILADINSWEAETGMILFVPSTKYSLVCTRTLGRLNSGDVIIRTYLIMNNYHEKNHHISIVILSVVLFFV